MENETEKIETVEILAPSALMQITKAEIDTQISTAKQYPRSMANFKKRATEMVTMDAETAASCIYRRPIGKEDSVDEKTGQFVKKEKFAEGKSIRLAEIVGACYGNLRVGATIIQQTERQVIARGYAHDLETNFASTSECIESTVTSKGFPYSERMRVVIAKVALSKARRDATFMVVPGALCKSIEIAARETALGKGLTMDQRRNNLLAWIKLLAIEEKRVWEMLGVKGIEDCGIDEMTTLVGLRTAIIDKEITIEEAFPLLKKEEVENKKEAIKEKKKEKTKDAETQEPETTASKFPTDKRNEATKTDPTVLP